MIVLCTCTMYYVHMYMTIREDPHTVEKIPAHQTHVRGHFCTMYVYIVPPAYLYVYSKELLVSVRGVIHRL